MAFELNALIGPLVTALLTGVGIYVAISNRLAVVETLIGELRKDVEKHNSVVERVALLEQSTKDDSATQWKRIDECRDDIKVLQTGHEGTD